MEVTSNHIKFWDAHKLRLAHRALLESEARRKLGVLYLATAKAKRRVYGATVPALPEAPSIHKLIPTCERRDSIFHRRAFGRQKARNSVGKDHHLMGNLTRFVAGKVRRGESLETAVLAYCGPLAGHQPYQKFARRWARKLGFNPEKVSS